MITEQKVFSVQCSVFRTTPGRALSPRAPSWTTHGGLGDAALPHPVGRSRRERRLGLFQPNSLTAYSLNNLLCLTALLTLCTFATGCGRRPAPPSSDLRHPTSALSPVLPPSTFHLPPPSTARQVSALVRTADAGVRATPAGSNAWVRVLQARAAYGEVLRQDGEYRDLVAKLARIEDIAATNAPGDTEAIGTGMAQRERTLVRDLPEAARARTAVERAERYYGTLVQADARYVESVRLIKTMGTNEAQAKAPQQAVEKGIRP